MVRCLPLSSPPRKLPLGSPVPLAAPHATDDLDRVPAAWPPFRKRQTRIHLSCHPHRRKMAWSAVARGPPTLAPSLQPPRPTQGGTIPAPSSSRMVPGTLSGQRSPTRKGRERWAPAPVICVGVSRRHAGNLPACSGLPVAALAAVVVRSAWFARRPTRGAVRVIGRTAVRTAAAVRQTARRPRAENGREHDAPALNGFHFATGLMPGL